MAIELTEFRVENLHGGQSVHLRLNDNILILVGENGTGKTTVINVLYYFLSRQWARLSHYEFDRATAVINGQEYVVERSWLRQAEWPHESRARHMRHLPVRAYEQLHLLSARSDLTLDQLAQWATAWGMSASHARDLVNEILHNPSQKQELSTLSDALQNVITDQILYLPTYRRIEQDLKTILPGIDESAVRKRIARHAGKGGFIELIEFGMEDVEQAVAEKMVQLKERVRTGLDTLTTGYLRDVIGGEYRSLSSESIKPEDLEGIEVVFSRIDEHTLPRPAKDRLREIVGKIQNRQWVEEEQKVIVWFLIRLLELHRRQEAAEAPVRQFVAVCNEYLVGKNLEFNSNEFTITLNVERADITSNPKPDGTPTIALRDLSSGEKQIVSLFGHLLLTGGNDFFVLIDEPELSLSVPWQTRFLPDLLDTGRCGGIVAVTHSPFIFDNDLDRYGRNITEFLTV